MKKNFEAYCKEISHLHKEQERTKYACLASLLPSYQMLVKLMERKEKGKHPFPNEFSYEERREKMKKAEETIESVLETKKGYEDTLESLVYLKKTARDCSEYIRMASLKEDFLWIASQFENAEMVLKAD